jgi:hypothetical protein
MPGGGDVKVSIWFAHNPLAIFRQDLTSRDLEENIYRVWYISRREGKYLNVCGRSKLSAELFELTSQWEPIVSSRDFGQNGDNGGKCKRSY